jgi:2-C-methyl-D-erythritol 2,4-cyclodiphosphate synthase
MRIGIGYDSHRFGGSGPLRLGGITIPHDRGLSGHSDADVLLHAIADALFGAIGAADIGQQFPPGEERTRGADSALFIRTAVEQVGKAGLRIGNVDSVVIADAPKLSDHKATMRAGIARLLGIAPELVGVKAKTTEGFDPRDAGISAHAVVLLLPEGKI